MFFPKLRAGIRVFPLWMLCAFLISGLAIAQEQTGSMIGKVTDPSGAAVPGATVEVNSERLVRTMSATTDASGDFIFGALPPGLYVVSVKATGFAATKQTDVPVQIGRQARLEVKLEVGSVTETVTVSGEALLVDTQQSTVATNVSADVYDRLPKGRSFDGLLQLAPGTRFEPKQGTGGAGGYSVDGASGSENVYTIDGTDMTTLLDGKLPRSAQIPVEFVAEAQVKSSFDAQYGGAVGGVVNATIRSGSNQFHGQGGVYLINRQMLGAPRDTLRLDPTNSVDPVAQYFKNGKDDYAFLNPYLTVGGRVVPDKLWFFAGYAPQFYTTERTTTVTGITGAQKFTSKEKQDYLTGKLDYAPLSRLRATATYIYSPYRQRGSLPGYQGLDSGLTPWSQYGQRSPAASYGGSLTYTANSKLTFYGMGSYVYRNFKLYGRPTGTYYTTTSTTGARDPNGAPLTLPFSYAAVDLSPNSRTTLQDIQTRGFTEVSANYLANFRGQHNIKVGYTRNDLANDSTGDGYPNDWVRFFWGSSYASVIAQPGTRVRGTYGYFRYRVFQLGTGNVSSSNNGIYLNDNWRVNNKLTLNLGLRTEREFIPSFSSNSNIPSKAITFGFEQKLAPRLGFAYDLRGDGKIRLFGGFNVVYDLFKYELPRGSFGGDKWVDYYYTLETTNIFGIGPTANCPSNCTGGRFIEARDNRIPSNDPSDNLLDPKLKPMRSHNYDAGIDIALSSRMVFSTRYTHRALKTAIEDVGLLTPQGEKYFITNPGYGYSTDPGRLGGYPATPKAVRDYDALELSLNRRFSRWLLSASYTLSRLYGNYSGLASSDENGRNSPNVNRYFDLPWNALTEQGTVALGRLATDRPHTFKLFTGYEVKSKLGSTNFAPVFFAYSGTPVTTELNIDGLPTYPFGRGDLGRTNVFSQTNLLISHDFKPFKANESMKVRLEFNAVNLFDQKGQIDRFARFDHELDGGASIDDPLTMFQGYSASTVIKSLDRGVDPRYGLTSRFQSPREIRMGLHFIF